jgi:hypothetical protein
MRVGNSAGGARAWQIDILSLDGGKELAQSDDLMLL